MTCQCSKIRRLIYMLNLSPKEFTRVMNLNYSFYEIVHTIHQLTGIFIGSKDENGTDNLIATHWTAYLLPTGIRMWE